MGLVVENSNPVLVGLAKNPSENITGATSLQAIIGTREIVGVGDASMTAVKGWWSTSSLWVFLPVVTVVTVAECMVLLLLLLLLPPLSLMVGFGIFEVIGWGVAVVKKGAGDDSNRVDGRGGWLEGLLYHCDGVAAAWSGGSAERYSRSVWLAV